MEMKKFNLGWISKYRNELFGLAILYVICYHFFADVGGALDNGLLSEGTAWATFIRGFQTWHGRSAVELFVFLSGMGLYYSFSKNSDLKRYYSRRYKRILIPYFIVALIFWIVKDFILASKGLKMFVADVSFYTFFSKGVRTIWFIGLLIFLYLVFPFIYKIIDKYKTKGFIILLGLSYLIPVLVAICSPELNKHTNIASTRVPMFILGVYFAQYIKAEKKISWIWAVLIILAGFALKVFTLQGHYPIVIERYLEGLYTLGLVVFLTVILHLISGLHPVNRALRYMGKYSIELYLIPVTMRNAFKQMGLPTYNILLFCSMLAFGLIIAPWFSKLCTWIGDQFVFGEPDDGESRCTDGASGMLVTDKVTGKKRIEWIDIMKCILIFLVVIGHSSKNKNTPDTVIYYIYAFHMPAFFFVSGMTFFLQAKSKIWSFGTLLKNKARQTLLPYATLGIILLAIWFTDYKIITHSDKSFKSQVFGFVISNDFYCPAHPSWFILALFLTTMVFAVICMWAAGKKNTLDIQSMTWKEDQIILIAAVICGVIGYIESMFREEIFHFPWYAEAVPMGVMLFALGFLFIKNYSSFAFMFRNRGNQIVSFLFLTATGMAAAAVNGKISMPTLYYHNFMLFIYAALAMTGATAILSMWLPKLRLLKMIGRNTIVILVLHTPITWTLVILCKPFEWLKAEYPLLSGLIVFAIMIPIAYVIERFFPQLIGRKKFGKAVSQQ